MQGCQRGVHECWELPPPPGGHTGHHHHHRCCFCPWPDQHSHSVHKVLGRSGPDPANGAAWALGGSGGSLWVAPLNWVLNWAKTLVLGLRGCESDAAALASAFQAGPRVGAGFSCPIRLGMGNRVGVGFPSWNQSLRASRWPAQGETRLVTQKRTPLPGCHWR